MPYPPSFAKFEPYDLQIARLQIETVSQFENIVIPEEFSKKILSGIQEVRILRNIFTTWIPAFAGMTNFDPA